MRRHALSIPRPRRLPVPRRPYSTHSDAPIISIYDAVFYRQHPTATAQDVPTNPAIFPNLTFEVPSSSPKPQHWAVIGPSSTGKTTFFEILRGQHLCFPPTARSFPYLSTPEIERKDHRLRVPSHAIQYVGFSGKYGGGLRSGSTTGAYLSARYESRREDTDFSVLDYLTGNMDLNPSVTENETTRNNAVLQRVIADLKLKDLVEMPVENLSNGQTRRAKIAKALLERPEVLLLDEPFMGLDPATLKTLSPMLYTLAEAQAPRILMSLRPQDPLPEWITHVVLLGPELRLAYQGPKGKAPNSLKKLVVTLAKPESDIKFLKNSREGLPLRGGPPTPSGEPIIEMRDVVVKYGDKTVLGNWQGSINGKTRPGLQWTVHRGERWGVFGPNGSGKTTLLSLICSDHPQAYSLHITLFSHPRLPRRGVPGISIFDLQSRIGHSSPEIHNFFPKHLSLRRTIESAWSDTFLSPPKLTYERDVLVDTYLRWFEPDLNPQWQPPPKPKSEYTFLKKHQFRHGKHTLQLDNPTDWADTLTFSSLPFSTQRLALFLRALIKKPDLVVLDEAFSGMDATLRDKCLLFLTWGTTKFFYPQPSSQIMRSGHGKEFVVKETPKEVFLAEGAEGGVVRAEGLEERQALIVVSHVREEVPALVRDWLCLPEAETGEKARFGRFEGPLEGLEGGWERIWGEQESVEKDR
ncbi:MAG: hypothetical protein Q9225_004631 [Loekoesia sp. 1 TL-2023]